ncbi:MAG: hypothetical protein WDO73_36605 [Ignavibacteriota bacterium]
MREAVKIDPEYAYAWCELGKLQFANQHIPDAHESFEAAAKAEPRWPDPYLRLALIAIKAHDWREVADATDHVLHLNSWEYPQAYFFNGAATSTCTILRSPRRMRWLPRNSTRSTSFRKSSNCSAWFTWSAIVMPTPRRNSAHTYCWPPMQRMRRMPRQQLATVERLAAQASAVAEKDQDQ